jgi:hypothetical protein
MRTRTRTPKGNTIRPVYSKKRRKLWNNVVKRPPIRNGVKIVKKRHVSIQQIKIHYHRSNQHTLECGMHPVCLLHITATLRSYHLQKSKSRFRRIQQSFLSSFSFGQFWVYEEATPNQEVKCKSAHPSLLANVPIDGTSRTNSSN